MDMNGFGMAGGPYYGTSAAELPIGLGMSLAMNAEAMNGYAGLTEAQKEQVILRCKDAKTREQMQEIVDSLAPGTDIKGIYEEEKESFS